MSSAITVVIATRQRPTELSDCLRSVLAQKRQAERIVVVDDAPGTDRTHAVVAGCGSVNGRVRYVRGDVRGLAAAHNRALLEVDTPLVAFTDDDVVVEAAWLEAIVAAFDAQAEAGCVTGQIRPRELDTQAQVWLEGYAGFDKGPEARVFDLHENHPANPLFPFAAGMLGSGANMAFRTDVLRELGGFDPALGAGTRARGGDDLAVFLEVLLHGYRLIYEPAAVVHHRHARELRDLRRQVYGYGIGLTAYLTKSFLDRPRLIGQAVRRLPLAAAHVLGPSSPKNARRPSDFPRRLTWLERLGMLAGPVAYLRSRSEARRHARSMGARRLSRSAP